MDDTTESQPGPQTARPQAHGWTLDGKQKITVTLAGVAMLVAGGIGTHAFVANHAGRYFVRSAEAQTTQTELTRQIRDASDAAKSASQSANSAAQAAQQAVGELRLHVALEEVKQARARLDVLRGEISNTQLWESANGANDVSRARRRDLESQIERTIAYIGCLEAQRANCGP